MESSTPQGWSAVVAGVAGLVLVPWFWLVEAVAPLEPDTPPLGGDPQAFVEFYAGNVDRLGWNATLYVVQWALVLTLVVAVAHAAGRGLAGQIATALATASTAGYVVAEGMRVWPVLAADLSAESVRADLDPALAAAAVASRDGLHAPAAVLLGLAVLVLAGRVATGDLWGRWVIAGLGALTGAVALSSVVVGTEGFGPGLVLVLWAPVTGVVLLVGRRRRRLPSPG